MLRNIDLSRKVAKEEYKPLKEDADLKLAALQRQVKALGIPVIVVFEGWSAAGKGTLINEMILPLDTRGFTVHSAGGPTNEETFYPFLWRFWKRTPTRGRIAIFDRSGPFAHGVVDEGTLDYAVFVRDLRTRGQRADDAGCGDGVQIQIDALGLHGVIRGGGSIRNGNFDPCLTCRHVRRRGT